MTTFIVNGNSGSLESMLKGVFEAGEAESFVVITNNKCSETNSKYIKELCIENSRVRHRRINANAKKWFAGYVKSSYINYLNEPDDRVVIIPTVAISGSCIDRYISMGIISNVSDYKSYKENAEMTMNNNYRSEMPKNDIEPGGRMHILIDFENVNNMGLQGAELITKEDEVTVFYSDCSKTIQQGYFNHLSEKSGSFGIVKLTQTRKNGLDFYIAIRVGEIIQKYPNEKILIVSQDQGFYAIMDYCTYYGGYSSRIKFAASIEAGIALLDGETCRRKTILENRRNTNLEAEYEKYREKMSLYNELSMILCDTPYEKELEKIFAIARSMDTPQKIYTATLHVFGAKRGQEIYRLIKRSA